MSLVALTLLLVAPTALAQVSMSLSPEKGPTGTEVEVSADGFETGESVEVRFAGDTVATGVASVGGSFSTWFTVPAVDPGPHQVEVLGDGQHASRRFVVTGGPSDSTTTTTAPTTTTTTSTTSTTATTSPPPPDPTPPDPPPPGPTDPTTPPPNTHPTTTPPPNTHPTTTPPPATEPPPATTSPIPSTPDTSAPPGPVPVATTDPGTADATTDPTIAAALEVLGRMRGEPTIPTSDGDRSPVITTAPPPVTASRVVGVVRVHPTAASPGEMFSVSLELEQAIEGTETFQIRLGETTLAEMPSNRTDGLTTELVVPDVEPGRYDLVVSDGRARLAAVDFTVTSDAEVGTGTGLDLRPWLLGGLGGAILALGYIALRLMLGSGAPRAWRSTATDRFFDRPW